MSLCRRKMECQTRTGSFPPFLSTFDPAYPATSPYSDRGQFTQRGRSFLNSVKSRAFGVQALSRSTCERSKASSPYDSCYYFHQSILPTTIVTLVPSYRILWTARIRLKTCSPACFDPERLWWSKGHNEIPARQLPQFTLEHDPRRAAVPLSRTSRLVFSEGTAAHWINGRVHES